MSNPLSIAAVTAALQALLARVAAPGSADSELSDTQVTTLPPDKAGMQEDHNQINLFLFQVQPNAPGRNLDGRGLPGRPPALALDLFYLLTVYGRSSNELLSHRLLGRAMSLLHSYPVLAPEQIESALPGSNLSAQSERVRVLPHAISTEEISRFWSTFQTKYRLSVAFRVSAVLIDHEVPVTDPPPPTRLQLGLHSSTGPGAAPATAPATVSGSGGSGT